MPTSDEEVLDVPTVMLNTLQWLDVGRVGFIRWRTNEASTLICNTLIALGRVLNDDYLV